MDAMNIQVQIDGKHVEAFERFKDRPEISPARKNTVAIKRLIETTPEWKEVTDG